MHIGQNVRDSSRHATVMFCTALHFVMQHVHAQGWYRNAERESNRSNMYKTTFSTCGMDMERFSELAATYMEQPPLFSTLSDCFMASKFNVVSALR